LILGSNRARVELTVLMLSLDCLMSVVATSDLGLPSNPCKFCPVGPEIWSFLLSRDRPANSLGGWSGFLVRLVSPTGFSDRVF